MGIGNLQTRRDRVIVIIFNLVIVLALYYWVSTWTVPGDDGVPMHLGPSPLRNYFLIAGVGLLVLVGSVAWPARLWPSTGFFPMVAVTFIPMEAVIVGMKVSAQLGLRYLPLLAAGLFAAFALLLQWRERRAARRDT